jgi:hypothetical protein
MVFWDVTNVILYRGTNCIFREPAGSTFTVEEAAAFSKMLVPIHYTSQGKS